MENSAADPSRIEPVEMEAELVRLRQVLGQRGWHEDPDLEFCWRWPATPPEGIWLFRAGPLILFDEEDPALGYLVEPPLLHDQAAPMLGYETADTLIRALDRIETWTYPQQAADIDPHHVVRLDDAGAWPAQQASDPID